MSIKALQEYTRFSKYAKHNPLLGRRETWDEQVKRVFDMHREKFGEETIAKIQDDFDFAEKMVQQKKVLGSQRALQFGGKPILLKHEKLYNCSASYCDRPRFFQECMFLLLCGCGTGFSVQKHHVAKLPNILAPSKANKGTKIFKATDDIEGWANCIGVLVSSYFDSDLTPFPEYRGCKVEFDLSEIRPAGSPISSGSKAPGPEPLKSALVKIEYLLDRVAKQKNRLDPIDAYDIVMFSSDAVLSGGIRRSASICIFSHDDDDMLKAKIGPWRIENKQRGRSNNSVLLLRNKTTKEDFSKIIEYVKEYGEPGFVWADDPEFVMNPCVAGDTWVTTEDGARQVLDLIGKRTKVYVDGEKHETSSEGFFKTGEKEVYRLMTKEGFTLKLTADHKIMNSEGKWVELNKLELGERIRIHNHSNISWDGDGNYQEGWLLGNLMSVGLLDRDNKPEILDKIAMRFDFHDAEISDTIEKTSKSFHEGFLRAYCDRNGVIENYDKCISIFPTSVNNMERLQRMLLRLGVFSKANNYELLIPEIDGFVNRIGFSDFNNALDASILIENSDGHSKSEFLATVESVVSLGVQPVYDCTVDSIHAFDANGIYVHNCGEIGMFAKLPITDLNRIELADDIKIQNDNEYVSGWQFCNLCEINVKKAKTEEEFLEACRAAAIIGTLQASYTTFDYLGKVSQDICNLEALLGVSMTGMADNPDIAFDTKLQKKGAKVILDVNERIALAIGINPCARATCVKPAGCQSPNTMVCTENGLMYLHEMGFVGGDQWQTHDVKIHTDKGIETSTKFYNNGYAPTKIITLDSGLILESTDNHKYRVMLDGEYIWKSADELKIGDLLPYKMGNYNVGSQYKSLKRIEFIKVKHANRLKSIEQPQYLDEDIAFLLGMYYGDGSNHTRSIRIHGSSKRKGFDKLLGILKNKFNVVAKEDFDHREGDRRYISANSKELVGFLKENKLSKEKSFEIKIPLLIRQSPKSVVESFIEGFNCADGNKDNNSGPSYCTVSYDFAKELVILLRSIGRDCKIILMPPTEQSRGNRVRYVVQERRGRTGQINKVRTYHRESYEMLDKLGLNDFSVDMILDIQDSASVTCDLEVPNSKTYLSNTYVSHNTSSCILGTASGIHPHHAKRYFRRVQANKMEVPLHYFQKFNPLAVEQSVWSDSDNIVTFLCEVPDGAKTKNQVDALTLLEIVKQTQQNWVECGTRLERCVKPWLKHNVSNTINIKPDEWTVSGDFIYDNRNFFTGISMLPVSGDKDYPQAPFTAVITPLEIVREYGEGSIMASGLIVDGLRAFNNNLWEACDCALGVGEIIDVDSLRSKISRDCQTNGVHWKVEGLSPETPEKLLQAWLRDAVKNYVDKVDWVRRAKQFADRYFQGDLRMTTYCMKDVANWKLWCDLKREYVDVDWSGCYEDGSGNLELGRAGIACSGGACDLGDLGAVIEQQKEHKKNSKKLIEV